MFRLRFADGAELVLTEGGKKKRAGVWLVTPEQLDSDLGHLGPDALELDAAVLGEILRRERRQIHPLLRDQRAIAGIGRAHANEILLRARLSPFKASTELDPTEIERLAQAIKDDLERALELRARGKGDADVYLIHNRLGEPCPQCGTLIARAHFGSTRSSTARAADGRSAAQDRGSRLRRESTDTSAVPRFREAESPGPPSSRFAPDDARGLRTARRRAIRRRPRGDDFDEHGPFHGFSLMWRTNS
jgi:formamidopyrimidine-DNA glycosylase